MPNGAGASSARADAGVVAQPRGRSRGRAPAPYRRSRRGAAVGRRPRDRRAQHAAAVVADQRRRIAAQPVVEGAERIPAEPIEIVPAHHGRLDARRPARGDSDRERSERRAVALEVAVRRLGSRRDPAGPTARQPTAPRRLPPDRCRASRRAAHRAPTAAPCAIWSRGHDERRARSRSPRRSACSPGRTRRAARARRQRPQQPDRGLRRPLPDVVRRTARGRCTNARSLYDEAMPNARPASCQRVPPSDGTENASCP